MQAATTPLLGGKGGHERLDDALEEVERSRLVVQKAFTTCYCNHPMSGWRIPRGSRR